MQVFGRFGGLLKIIIFSRNENVSSLVQFASVETATAAKVSLDGQCIYTDCNILRVQFSRMESITVKYNNEKSRDFTDPTLPSMPHQQLSPTAEPFGFQPTGESSPVAHQLSPTAEPFGLQGAAAGNVPMTQYVEPMYGEGMASTIQAGSSESLKSLSSVVIINGIKWTEKVLDHLFVLFGVYGDVVRRH